MVAVIVLGLTAAVLVGIWRGRRTMADLQPGLELAGRALGVLTGLGSLGIGLAVLDLIEPSDPFLSRAVGAGLVVGGVVLAGASVTPVRSRIIRGAMVAGWIVTVIGLTLSLILGFLLPVAAAGAASFAWMPTRGEGSTRLASMTRTTTD